MGVTGALHSANGCHDGFVWFCVGLRSCKLVIFSLLPVVESLKSW